MLRVCVFLASLAGARAGIFKQRQQDDWSEMAPPELNISDPKAIQKMCDQKLDHFDPKNEKTWCQRYLVNASVHEPGGPVFVCIDGEDYPWMSGGRSYTMACNNMVELASKFGAMMLALEHRYYGGAAFDGVPDFTTENLKYHSSRQALADLAQFHDFMKPKLGDVPWVVFGGSYPGALSAWARKLYPERFAASVASSAPLLAQANFVGYNDVVASALTAPTVGGSPECLGTYAKGHAEAVELMKTMEGRRSLEKKFKLCGNNILDDSENFAWWAGTDGIVSTVPQYNNPRCEHTSCNIKLFCGNLTRLQASAASALDTLVLMAEYQDFEDVARGRKVPECRAVDYMEEVRSWNATEKVPGSDPKAGAQFMRLWFYQTCNEFGWYQTCETGTNCPYSQGYNVLQWQLEMCQLLFDMSPAEVLANIDATNRYYGGSEFPNATKVVFPNGEVDPWHWESCLVSPEPTVATLFVKGASHCEWMHAARPGDTETLRLAKEAIENRIASWLPPSAQRAAKEPSKVEKPEKPQKHEKHEKHEKEHKEEAKKTHKASKEAEKAHKKAKTLLQQPIRKTKFLTREQDLEDVTSYLQVSEL